MYNNLKYHITFLHPYRNLIISSLTTLYVLNPDGDKEFLKEGDFGSNDLSLLEKIHFAMAEMNVDEFKYEAQKGDNTKKLYTNILANHFSHSTDVSLSSQNIFRFFFINDGNILKIYRLVFDTSTQTFTQPESNSIKWEYNVLNGNIISYGFGDYQKEIFDFSLKRLPPTHPFIGKVVGAKIKDSINFAAESEIIINQQLPSFKELTESVGAPDIHLFGRKYKTPNIKLKIQLLDTSEKVVYCGIIDKIEYVIPKDKDILNKTRTVLKVKSLMSLLDIPILSDYLHPQVEKPSTIKMIKESFEEFHLYDQENNLLSLNINLEDKFEAGFFNNALSYNNAEPLVLDMVKDCLYRNLFNFRLNYDNATITLSINPDPKENFIILGGKTLCEKPNFDEEFKFIQLYFRQTNFKHYIKGVTGPWNPSEGTLIDGVIVPYENKDSFSILGGIVYNDNYTKAGLDFKVSKDHNNPQTKDDISLTNDNVLEPQITLGSKPNEELNYGFINFDYSDNDKNPFIPFYTLTFGNTTDILTKDWNRAQSIKNDSELFKAIVWKRKANNTYDMEIEKVIYLHPRDIDEFNYEKREKIFNPSGDLYYVYEYNNYQFSFQTARATKEIGGTHTLPSVSTPTTYKLHHFGTHTHDTDWDLVLYPRNSETNPNWDTISYRVTNLRDRKTIGNVRGYSRPGGFATRCSELGLNISRSGSSARNAFAKSLQTARDEEWVKEGFDKSSSTANSKRTWVNVPGYNGLQYEVQAGTSASSNMYLTGIRFLKVYSGGNWFKSFISPRLPVYVGGLELTNMYEEEFKYIEIELEKHNFQTGADTNISLKGVLYSKWYNGDWIDPYDGSTDRNKIKYINKNKVIFTYENGNESKVDNFTHKIYTANPNVKDENSGKPKINKVEHFNYTYKKIKVYTKSGTLQKTIDIDGSIGLFNEVEKLYEKKVNRTTWKEYHTKIIEIENVYFVDSLSSNFKGIELCINKYPLSKPNEFWLQKPTNQLNLEFIINGAFYSGKRVTKMGYTTKIQDIWKEGTEQDKKNRIAMLTVVRNAYIEWYKYGVNFLNHSYYEYGRKPRQPNGNPGREGTQYGLGMSGERTFRPTMATMIYKGIYPPYEENRRLIGVFKAWKDDEQFQKIAKFLPFYNDGFDNKRFKHLWDNKKADNLEYTNASSWLSLVDEGLRYVGGGLKDLYDGLSGLTLTSSTSLESVQTLYVRTATDFEAGWRLAQEGFDRFQILPPQAEKSILKFGRNIKGLIRASKGIPFLGGALLVGSLFLGGDGIDDETFTSLKEYIQNTLNDFSTALVISDTWFNDKDTAKKLKKEDVKFIQNFLEFNTFQRISNQFIKNIKRDTVEVVKKIQNPTLFEFPHYQFEVIITKLKDGTLWYEWLDLKNTTTFDELFINGRKIPKGHTLIKGEGFDKRLLPGEINDRKRVVYFDRNLLEERKVSDTKTEWMIIDPNIVDNVIDTEARDERLLGSISSIIETKIREDALTERGTQKEYSEALTIKVKEQEAQRYDLGSYVNVYETKTTTEGNVFNEYGNSYCSQVEWIFGQNYSTIIFGGYIETITDKIKTQNLLNTEEPVALEIQTLPPRYDS